MSEIEKIENNEFQKIDTSNDFENFKLCASYAKTIFYELYCFYSLKITYCFNINMLFQ